MSRYLYETHRREKASFKVFSGPPVIMIALLYRYQCCPCATYKEILLRLFMFSHWSWFKLSLECILYIGHNRAAMKKVQCKTVLLYITLQRETARRTNNVNNPMCLEECTSINLSCRLITRAENYANDCKDTCSHKRRVVLYIYLLFGCHETWPELADCFLAAFDWFGGEEDS